MNWERDYGEGCLCSFCNTPRPYEGFLWLSWFDSPEKNLEDYVQRAMCKHCQKEPFYAELIIQHYLTA